MLQALLDQLQTLPGLVVLLIAGVLLAVVGLNLREALRLRRLTDRVRTRVEPVEPGGQPSMASPLEGRPMLIGDRPTSDPSTAEHQSLTDDLEPRFDISPSTSVRSPGIERLHRDLSERDEWVVTFDGSGLEHVSHELILAQFKDWHRCGQKTVRFGMDDQDRLAVGLLLVTRQGGLSLTEYNQFYDRLSAGLAECPGVDATAFMAELPDFSVCHARSRERLRVVESLDGQLVFHLQSDHPASTQNTAAFLTAMGLTERAEGRFSRLDEQSEAVYSVLPGDQGFNLSFMLDMPRVANPTSAFAELIDLAQACAEAFSGRLVDDVGRPLTADWFAQFAQQVASREQALVATGLVPGCWINRKIFS